MKANALTKNFLESSCSYLKRENKAFKAWSLRSLFTFIEIAIKTDQNPQLFKWINNF